MTKYGSAIYGQDLYGDSGSSEPSSGFWTNLDGGNHRGEDWIISTDTTVANLHYNVGVFKVETGVTLYIEHKTASDYGTFEVRCKQAVVEGAIQGTGRGYAGGGGGGGGGGSCIRASAGSGGDFGTSENGLPGYPGSAGSVATIITGGLGGDGGDGSGPKGGSLGLGGSASEGGTGSAGGYEGTSENNDVSTDESTSIGSGGGGGGGGAGGSCDYTVQQSFGGGGGGGSCGGNGGAEIRIVSQSDIIVSGKIMSNGDAPTGEAQDGHPALPESAGDGGFGGDVILSPTNERSEFGKPGDAGEGSNGNDGYAGGAGGCGSGGGILLHAERRIVVTGNVMSESSGIEPNGGTVKLFAPKGTIVTSGAVSAGRVLSSETLVQGSLF